MVDQEDNSKFECRVSSIYVGWLQGVFSSAKAESISDHYLKLKSLDVEVEMSKPVGDRLGYKRYDEDDLPSCVHISL